MAIPKRDAARPVEPFDVVTRMLDRWPDLARWPVLGWADPATDALRIEEYREDGTLVIRAELPGIDPDEDVEVTVAEGVLHIGAERREEEQTEGRHFYRRELRYGAFHRDVALPEGATAADISASYRDGILEIRVPTPAPAAAKEATRVAVAKG